MEFIILIARPDWLDSDLNDRITFFSFMAFLFTFLTRKRLPHKEKSQASLRRLTRRNLFLSFCLSLILFFSFHFCLSAPGLYLSVLECLRLSVCVCLCLSFCVCQCLSVILHVSVFVGLRVSMLIGQRSVCVCLQHFL